MARDWWPWLGAGIGLAAGLAAALRPQPSWNVAGQVAVITGGSRGLGLLLAREFGREGCQLAICARDEAELDRARGDLEARGMTVYAARCDVADRRDVERFVADVIRRFGGIDILVNNAGIIKVGPFTNMTVEDFEEAMRINFWGMVYPTLAMLRVMQAQGGGRIVNITSIDGKVTVPHLLPYICAKFAAVAFSEGLHMELAADGITVVTVVPGLMRTGSCLNATFTGDPAAESVWFSLGSTPEVILSAPARLLVRLHGLFPSLTTALFRLANQVVLPEPDGDSENTAPGHEAIARGGHSPVLEALTRLGRSAADRFGQHPGPRVPARGRPASRQAVG